MELPRVRQKPTWRMPLAVYLALLTSALLWLAAQVRQDPEMIDYAMFVVLPFAFPWSLLLLAPIESTLLFVLFGPGGVVINLSILVALVRSSSRRARAKNGGAA